MPATSRLNNTIIALIVSTLLYPHGIVYPVKAETQTTVELPQIQLNQTATMKVTFLGVSSEYIDEGIFLSKVTRSVKQFTQPNNMTWNLDISTSFHEFPEEVTTALIDNAYTSEDRTYYNITLLDNLLSQPEYLTAPQKGYLFIFMSIPDNGANHSWFYNQERPDLLLGRTDTWNSNSATYWAFPPYFGGIRRALYFDLSDSIEKNPIKAVVTNNAITLFNNALSDVFVDLLGTTDSRMIAADEQRYKNYEVRTLWLNGTDGALHSEQIEHAFEDIMPWTNWTLTTQTKSMDEGLNSLIESRTIELPTPINYSFLLASGSQFSVQANRNVQWNVMIDSGEDDPLTQYLFQHVQDYFGLTDMEDKSIIPVVFLQTRNDTAMGGVAGLGLGISWFPHNIIILGYQGGAITTMGESGPLMLTQQLRHEIGHWISLSHHSERFESGYPKAICSMRALTNQFCVFCKDARARMSFISYYKATAELISDNQIETEHLRNELEDALQLFNDWKYIQAVEAIILVHDNAQAYIPPSADPMWIGLGIVGVAIIALALILRKRISSWHISNERKASRVQILSAAQSGIFKY